MLYRTLCKIVDTVQKNVKAHDESVYNGIPESPTIEREMGRCANSPRFSALLAYPTFILAVCGLESETLSLQQDYNFKRPAS